MVASQQQTVIIIIIIIIIIKNEKIRVTLCENAAGALYIVNNNWLATSTAKQLQICTILFRKS